MAIEFKPSMKKDELLEIAVLNGIAADDSMTRAQIMDGSGTNRRTARKRPAERRRGRRNVRAG